MNYGREGQATNLYWKKDKNNKMNYKKVSQEAAAH